MCIYKCYCVQCKTFITLLQVKSIYIPYNPADGREVACIYAPPPPYKGRPQIHPGINQVKRIETFDPTHVYMYETHEHI